jgi:tetratricopeptide (TPR) repeat protein
VDQGLVQRLPPAGGVARFGMLETVREFALERLVAADEADEAARAHALYWLALSEEAEPRLRGPEQQDWMDRLARDHDNFRAALGWADAAGEATLGLRLAGALEWFWYIRGHFGEGRLWLERFLAQGPQAPLAVRAKALQGAAGLATMLGDGPSVRSRYEEAIALYQELGDWFEYARALHNLGSWIYQWEGDYDTSRTLFEEALTIGRRHGGPERLIGFCLSHLGYIAYLQGDNVTARGLLEESLAVQRPGPDKYGIGMVLSQLGRVARAEGDAAGARALQAEALTMRREFVGPWGVALPLAGIAELALDGHPATTARLLGVLDAMDALRGDLPMHLQAARAAMADAARRALGDAEFEAARAAGRSLPLEQAVAEALAFVTSR